MDKVFVDKTFKIGLLVLGCIFLFLYSFHGRYEYSAVGNSIAAFDTSKGILYVVTENAEGRIDIVSRGKKGTKEKRIKALLK